MTQRLVAEIVSRLRSEIPDVALGWETRSGSGYGVAVYLEKLLETVAL